MAFRSRAHRRKEVSKSKVVICALYKFVELPDFEFLREPLQGILEENRIFGTLLLAHEGINGTFAGSREGVDAVLTWLDQQPGLESIVIKESYDENMPFHRTKVKLKEEIVTMGVEGINPKCVVGTYVKPVQWNDLISDPDAIVIDTRNDFEYKIGTFKNAVNPKIDTFRQFPSYVKENLDPSKHKKIAMFCTGGIRCEKSTSFLKKQGFDDVYHLEGGILKYLEEVPQEESMWEGDCFVFDNRVSVNHQLEKGKYDQCHACRMPITEEEKQNEYYQQGVSCVHCHDKLTNEQRRRFIDRERQVQLARSRGEKHIGAEVLGLVEKHRLGKVLGKERHRSIRAVRTQ